MTWRYSLKHLEQVAGLIQCDTTCFLTSTQWAGLAAELPVNAFTDKGRLPKPGNFKRLNIRGKHILTVVNSGTEDEDVCRVANWEAERKANFREARDKFAIRPDQKKDALEFVDAESTWEPPEDLTREIADRAEKGAISIKQVRPL